MAATATATATATGGGGGGGGGGGMAVTWRPRGRVAPSDPRTQRHGWAREWKQSNGTTASHGLHKLEIVVIVDSRVLDLYWYSLIKTFSSFSSIERREESRESVKNDSTFARMRKD